MPILDDKDFVELMTDGVFMFVKVGCDYFEFTSDYLDHWLIYILYDVMWYDVILLNLSI